jgi:hypothetical protein
MKKLLEEEAAKAADENMRKLLEEEAAKPADTVNRKDKVLGGWDEGLGDRGQGLGFGG